MNSIETKLSEILNSNVAGVQVTLDRNAAGKYLAGAYTMDGCLEANPRDSLWDAVYELHLLWDNAGQEIPKNYEELSYDD